MHNAVAGGLAIASLGFATLTGVETAVKYTNPPAIEGSAVRVSPVRAGETITLEWAILKRSDCPGEFSRVWVGENGFRVVEARRSSSIPAADEERRYRIPTEVPSLAPVGNLELYINGEYDCPGGSQYYSLGPVSLVVEE